MAECNKKCKYCKEHVEYPNYSDGGASHYYVCHHHDIPVTNFQHRQLWYGEIADDFTGREAPNWCPLVHGIIWIQEVQNATD